MKIWRERKKNRACWHNYSEPGIYFITICTGDREQYFGKISNNEMQLSEIGRLISQCWEKIVEISPDIELDHYVVMPNHFHGILILKNSIEKGLSRNGDSEARQYQRLPVVIGSFKSAVTKMVNAKQDCLSFCWQKSYYDHIIRSSKSLNFIRQYIIDNPANWQDDLDNPSYLLDLTEEERKKKLEDHYDNLFKYDSD